MLEARGFGRRRPHVAEKVMRVVHTAAFLTALLGHEGQQIFWMSDHDAVCPNPAMHDQMLSLYHNILTLYTAKTFGRIGGGHPFDDRSTDFLDLRVQPPAQRQVRPGWMRLCPRLRRSARPQP
jgi:hypothetical protein